MIKSHLKEKLDDDIFEKAYKTLQKAVILLPLNSLSLQNETYELEELE